MQPLVMILFLKVLLVYLEAMANLAYYYKINVLYGHSRYILSTYWEANINICAPAPSLPSIVAHEMAHQRGYARENEANFISFLACVYNPYTEFKYSGFLLALTYSMNALRKEDLISYKNLITLYSDGLSRDITYINKFWKRYEGPIEKFSTDVNNAYLKANNQKDGIKSYGKMVDLLIAYYMENEH